MNSMIPDQHFNTVSVWSAPATLSEALHRGYLDLARLYTSCAIRNDFMDIATRFHQSHVNWLNQAPQCWSSILPCRITFSIPWNFSIGWKGMASLISLRAVLQHTKLILNELVFHKAFQTSYAKSFLKLEVQVYIRPSWSWVFGVYRLVHRT